MRLLRLEDDGEFSLIKFDGNNIPRYAILSHTWGADDEELTFKDLVEGTGKSQAGYRKIRFCGKQAANDGLQFSWVDTCCIDKSSSTELLEAINSMFRWYQNAARCYVYLSDVSIGGSIRNDLPSQWTWKLAFQHSRWFTRGWTLQELVAPTSVEFFSVEGERLGDKNSLVQEIHKITGISVQALQGSPLSRFSVDERMSWAARRETKREEDAAYSLLGIFDIHMPLIYGEGRKKALIRLRKEINESSMDSLEEVLDISHGGEREEGFFAQIPGASRRALSLQQMYDAASQKVAAGIGTVGRILGGVLSLMREEDEDDVEDYHYWGEEVEQQNSAQISGALRRTPSPQQIFDATNWKVVTSMTAVDAALRDALSSIREEEKDNVIAEARKQNSKTLRKYLAR